MKHEAIADAWAARNKLYIKLRDEGDKLYIEGDKLYIEGYRLFAEGRKLYAEGKKLREEGDKLYAEGDKLRVEGDKLYRDAVTAKYGDEAVIDWKTGEITIGEALIIMGEGE